MRLNKNTIGAIILTSIFLAISCTKTIEFKLNNKNNLVIEALITDSVQNHYVKVSNSADFYSTKGLEYISTANIRIFEDNILKDSFEYNQNGYYYSSSKWKAEPAKNYKLQVQVGNKTYTAYQKLPPQVDFVIEKYIISYNTRAENYKITLNQYQDRYFTLKGYIQVGDSLYKIKISATYKTCPECFYRLDIYRNDSKFRKQDVFFVLNNEILNGSFTDLEVPGYFLKGDTVSAIVYNTNKEVFKFYQSIITSKNYEGGLFSPPPGNPTSNFDNNEIIGFFECASAKKISIIIK